MNNCYYYHNHDFLDAYGRVEWTSERNYYVTYLMRNSRCVDLPNCQLCGSRITPYCLFVVEWPKGEVGIPGRPEFIWCKDCAIDWSREAENDTISSYFARKIEETTCLRSAPCYLVHMTRGV
jgi:hypothetical protein